MDHQITARRTDLVLINNKKITRPHEEFAVSAEHWIKMKESKNIDKYMDLPK